ncbi:class I SAM-dependent DNA methyltransferase [soil metagenome]
MTESERLRQLERRLWQAADQLRANSRLRAADYSIPVLGLIFLRYADVRFGWAEERLAATATVRSPVTKAHYQAEGVMYVPEPARFGYLRTLPESADLGRAVNDAMAAIEDHNPDLTGVLPRDYGSFERPVLVELLRLIGSIPEDIEGDAFGTIYEYFLGNFAMTEGHRGGEFFTPTSIVKLIVDIIEPFSGRVYDPACGSGGMFVQSARFVDEHKGNGSTALSVYGQERVDDTVRLCKMNLAVHGLSGDIQSVNTYYEDPHRSVGRFDFVMANPPFNVNGVDKERIKDDPRFGLGIPSVDNANYLWIQVFSSALKDTGRAGFVMANSASDARHSELAVRRKLVEDRQVDIVVAVGSNFFYTVTLPVTLWFLDKGKRNTERADQVLFVDARHIYRQIDRAHRDFTPEQHEFLANITRLYRGEEPEFLEGSETMVKERFPDLEYVDVPGLSKVATLDEIEAHGWSLNPGRYVGVTDEDDDDFDFAERFGELSEKLQALITEAADLNQRVLDSASQLLSG